MVGMAKRDRGTPTWAVLVVGNLKMTQTAVQATCDFIVRTPFSNKMQAMRRWYEQSSSVEKRVEQVFWVECVSRLRRQDAIRAHVHWFPSYRDHAVMVEPIGIPTLDTEQLAWLLVSS